jgi:hypothetical protein
MSRQVCRWRSYTAVALLLPASLFAQDAVLVGRVLSGASEAPVNGAIIEIPAFRRSLRSDSLGSFRIGAIPPGTHQVIVRAIGFDRWSGVLQFDAGATIEVDMVLGSTLTRLATRRIVADGPTRLEATLLREFEDRRRTGLGQFLTKEYFEENVGRDVGQLIVRRFAGLRHNMKVGWAEEVYVARRGVNCTPNFIINGVPVPEFRIGLLQAGEILGFEFHTAATLPAAYNVTQKTACGSFIVWTR